MKKLLGALTGLSLLFTMGMSEAKADSSQDYFDSLVLSTQEYHIVPDVCISQEIYEELGAFLEETNDLHMAVELFSVYVEMGLCRVYPEGITVWFEDIARVMYLTDYTIVIYEVRSNEDSDNVAYFSHIIPLGVEL